MTLRESVRNGGLSCSRRNMVEEKKEDRQLTTTIDSDMIAAKIYALFLPHINLEITDSECDALQIGLHRLVKKEMTKPYRNRGKEMQEK